MDIIGIYAQLTADVVNITGMTRPMLHMHAGMAIYIVTQFLLGQRRGSLVAIGSVLQIELINEVMNRLHKGYFDWPDTCEDIVLTLFWPSMCYAASKYRRWKWTNGKKGASGVLTMSDAWRSPSEAAVSDHRRTRHGRWLRAHVSDGKESHGPAVLS